MEYIVIQPMKPDYSSTFVVSEDELKDYPNHREKEWFDDEDEAIKWSREYNQGI